MKRLHIALLALLVAAGSAAAQTTVTSKQGAASSSAYRGWRVQGDSSAGATTSSSGNPVLIGGTDGTANRAVRTNPAGQIEVDPQVNGSTAGTTTNPLATKETPLEGAALGPLEWCPTAAVTTLTPEVVTDKAYTLPGRRHFAIFRSPTNISTCFFGFDAASLTTTGSRGIPSIPGDTSLNFEYGDAFVLSAACTTNPVSPNCFQILQAR